MSMNYLRYDSPPQPELVEAVRELLMRNHSAQWSGLTTGSRDQVFRHTSGNFYLKCFAKSWKTWLGKSPIRMNRLKNQLMEKHGLEAPKICLWGRQNGIDFIITPTIVGRTLKQVFQTEYLNDTTPLTFALRRQLLAKLAKSIGIMHSRRIYHGDLNSDNLLISWLDGDFSITFLDNEKNQQRPFISASLAYNNLRQLNSLEAFSVHERLRFLSLYHQVCPQWNRPELSELISTLAFATSQRWNKKMARRAASGLAKP